MARGTFQCNEAVSMGVTGVGDMVTTLELSPLARFVRRKQRIAFDPGMHQRQVHAIGAAERLGVHVGAPDDEHFRIVACDHQRLFD